MNATSASRPILFAFDGSDLAEHAIEVAGGLLDTASPAIVLTVWRPFDIGFIPSAALSIDAARITEVWQAAETTAAEGAALATAAGFEAVGLTVESSPIWSGIGQVAEDRDARLIVLGSHGRKGLAGPLVGRVAGTVAAHSQRPVLIVHRG
jgi:nucleotide-binding universal stress UspA family protein